MAVGPAIVPFARWGILPLVAGATQQYEVSITEEDDRFLEELERAGFQYFWEQTNPQTGMVRDRFNLRSPDSGVVASIAATGFGLTALCIGHKRGFVPFPQARGRVLATLRFLWRKLPNHRGFFYHFANLNTGERIWDSEVSSVDTAILLCGILTCRQYFENSDVNQLADAVFNRVDWTWLSEDTSLLPHGWTPEIGFLPYRWDGYSEHFWGITASDSANGYVVWGGPPAIGPIDGSVAPSAAGGSLPFMPQPTIRVLRHIKNNYGDRAWSAYGFVNALNPARGWYDTDVVGIDTGVTMIMAENARTGFVWDTFMKNPEAKRGMQ